MGDGQPIGRYDDTTSEFFPKDIAAVLSNPLTQGTFMALPSTGAAASSLQWDPHGRGWLLPPSFAVMSLWNSKGVYKMEMREASTAARALVRWGTPPMRGCHGRGSRHGGREGRGREGFRVVSVFSSSWENWVPQVPMTGGMPHGRVYLRSLYMESINRFPWQNSRLPIQHTNHKPHSYPWGEQRGGGDSGIAVGMAGKAAAAAAKTVAKAVGEYQYPWREKLSKYKDELSKGVWGYWELGAWKPLALSARRRARLRKEVLLAGQDWPYDPPRKEMRSKRKGHKCDRVSAEKRANTAELMKKMPQMLLDYKKRRWEKKMKEEETEKD